MSNSRRAGRTPRPWNAPLAPLPREPPTGPPELPPGVRAQLPRRTPQRRPHRPRAAPASEGGRPTGPPTLAPRLRSGLTTDPPRVCPRTPPCPPPAPGRAPHSPSPRARRPPARPRRPPATRRPLRGGCKGAHSHFRFWRASRAPSSQCAGPDVSAATAPPAAAATASRRRHLGRRGRRAAGAAGAPGAWPRRGAASPEGAATSSAESVRRPLARTRRWRREGGATPGTPGAVRGPRAAAGRRLPGGEAGPRVGSVRRGWRCRPVAGEGGRSRTCRMESRSSPQSLSASASARRFIFAVERTPWTFRASRPGRPVSVSVGDACVRTRSLTPAPLPAAGCARFCASGSVCSEMISFLRVHV